MQLKKKKIQRENIGKKRQPPVASFRAAFFATVFMPQKSTHLLDATSHA
jgi:hypothetical protein